MPGPKAPGLGEIECTTNNNNNHNHFLQTGFLGVTEAIATSLIPLVTNFPEICASLALLCGLK